MYGGTDGYIYITLKTESFLVAVAELTEHTKVSLQSSDASVSLQELVISLSCYKHVDACLTFSTVRPLI